MIEELGDACCQVAVDAVHVAGCSHDGTHVFVAVLDTFLHLNAEKHRYNTLTGASDRDGKFCFYDSIFTNTNKTLLLQH